MLRNAFKKRDVLEDKVIGENPQALDSRFVGMATNRRNLHKKAYLALRQIAAALITELEAEAWRSDHPIKLDA